MHPNLKFTLKVEAEGKFFLFDLCINHVNNKLSSTCYYEPTDTGPIMNYHTLAPKCYNRSVLKGFVHRVSRACTSWENFHDSIEKIFNTNVFIIQSLVIIAKTMSPKEN